MKILHYTLGFPPSRTGGLVSYSINLMKNQSKLGHEVYCLYPGNVNYFNRKVNIKKRDNKNSIEVYEIKNSLPLAIFKGINTPRDFTEEVSMDIYEKLLNEIKPDVIHIHTVMGIHLEFFVIANMKKIPIIFTSNDYYGLFPIPSFYYEGKSYDNDNSSKNWLIASKESLSTRKLRIFQSKYYPFVRKIMRTIYRITDKDVPVNNDLEKKISENMISEMDKLRKYYLDIFSKITFYHFNSSVAKKVFTNNLPFAIKGETISITNIENRIEIVKVNKTCKTDKVRIGFIGPDEDYKGFFDYVSLSNKLSNNSYEFHTFGYTNKHPEFNLKEHGKYSSKDLGNIYSLIDILIVPSKWKETFGLITIEALSFGKEVFVSENVGAKDILDDYHIYTTIDDLVSKINNVSTKCFCLNNDLRTTKEHSLEIIQLYNGLVRR